VFPVYTTFRGVEVDRILGEALGVDQKVRVGKLQTRKWGQSSREERAINLRQVFKTGKKQMLFIVSTGNTHCNIIFSGFH
jgi:hypothetical protein